MESSALLCRLLEHRVSCNPTSGCIPVWRVLLEDLNLPSTLDFLANQRAHNSWKLATERLLTIHSNLSLRVDCPLIPIGSGDLPLGKPAPHWALTLMNTKKTHSNNFHIRLLAGCDSLETDASRFRQRQNGRSPNDPSCKLCEALLEDSLHVKEALPDPACNPDRFFNLIFGVEWLSDTDAQLYFVNFLNNLKSHRNSLLIDL